jgi:phosphoglycerol transferase MdoB-like AlkP superfamily enzyme
MTLGSAKMAHGSRLGKTVMQPRRLLRTAAVLTLVHALLNTFAGLLSGISRSQDEMAVLSAMKALRFDAMGSLRTYWDFYFGFGLFLTVSLLLLSVLIWQLAALVDAEPGKVRPLIAALCIGFLAFAVLSALFFFIAPVAIEVLVATLLGLTYAAVRS